MWWSTSTGCSSPRPEQAVPAVRDEPWFIYTLDETRFRAAPARWEGWAVLVGGLLFSIFGMIASIALTEGLPLALRIFAAALPNLVGIGLILLIAYRTGRPSR